MSLSRRGFLGRLMASVAALKVPLSVPPPLSPSGPLVMDGWTRTTLQPGDLFTVAGHDQSMRQYRVTGIISSDSV